MEAQSDLDWLTSWYSSQCDGHWEHGYGVRIESLDNPGWSLSVSLVGTPLEGRTLARRKRDYDHDLAWSICWADGTEFGAAGGPGELGRMIRAFRKWVEQLAAE